MVSEELLLSQEDSRKLRTFAIVLRGLWYLNWAKGLVSNISRSKTSGMFLFFSSMKLKTGCPFHKIDLVKNTFMIVYLWLRTSFTEIMAQPDWSLTWQSREFRLKKYFAQGDDPIRVAIFIVRGEVSSTWGNFWTFLIVELYTLTQYVIIFPMDCQGTIRIP